MLIRKKAKRTETRKRDIFRNLAGMIGLRVKDERMAKAGVAFTAAAIALKLLLRVL